jgi:hypothetical protein
MSLPTAQNGPELARFAALLDGLESNGVRVVIVERARSASRGI